MASICIKQCCCFYMVFLLFVLPCVFSKYSTFISVWRNNSSIGCNQSNSTTIVCHSLDDLADDGIVADHTQVTLLGTSFNLSRKLSIQRVTELGFVSGPNFTSVVYCNGGSLFFKQVTTLEIAGVSFVNCSAQYNSTSFYYEDKLQLWSAIYIQDCSNVTINDVSVNQSSGFGIVFYDTNGTVTLNNSAFDGNVGTSKRDGGGGVYIEFTSCPPGSEYSPSKCKQHINNYNRNSAYTIQDCTFKGNKASSSQDYVKAGGIRTFGQGGGLLIAVHGRAFRNSFSLSNCIFEDNQAVWGGGLHIYLRDAISHTNISVVDCKFLNNSALQGGGGFTLYTYSPSGNRNNTLSNNSIYIANSEFFHNTATDHAGGTLCLISVFHYDMVKRNDTIHFNNCSWHGNSAAFSAAVDITSRHSFDPATGPFPRFTNCTFKSNFVVDKERVIQDDVATQIVVGKATFMITYARAIFEKAVHFENNTGSALYVGSGLVEFVSGIHSKFINNSGVYGGAISLKSSSFMEVGPNTIFDFTNNSAIARGGAIYSYSISQHDLHHHTTSLGCFFHAKRHNVTFIFTGNEVRSSIMYNRGQSVYATSLQSCSFECNYEFNAFSLFNCTANFTFVGSSPEKQIAGPGWNFILPQKHFSVIPGKEFDLLFNVTDGLNNSVPSTIKASVDESFGVVVDSAYSFHSGRKMKVHGQPGTTFVLKLERTGFRKLFLHLNITLLECPPGYTYLNSTDKVSSCECASNENYFGIVRCSKSKFRSYILRGFWAGYWNGNATQANFRTAHCPLNFCVYNNASFLHTSYLLPATADAEELSSFICNKNRTGVLCGSCIENHSVYFHSPEYKCGPNRNCEYGIILYIVSELFPLTVIFVMVMAFNVSFTSGILNGFILFAQVISTLALDTYSLRDARHVNTIPAFMFLYGFFNLHFFSLDPLSFCLWKGAKTLDVIAFKYVTILFAFCLVLITILVMKFCNVARFCRVLKQRTTRSSVIHGLSTFLVMCYVQCVRVSFDILTPRVIRGLGNNEWEFRVLISGDTELFKGNHFRYAIPALFCLMVVVVMPLILLLWFPMGQKLLSFCGLGESKLSRIINKVLCIYKLTPLLDSFQSCFKDNFRFFAGLYFLYRCLSQVAFSFTIGPTQFYILIEVLFIVMLLLHAIAQPYKKRCYNIIDTLLFANLAVINTLSIFLHTKSANKYYKTSITLASITQAILIILPLICCLAVILFRFGMFLKPYITKKSWKRSKSLFEDSLPARLLDDDFERTDNEEKALSPAELSKASYHVLGSSQELQQL